MYWRFKIFYFQQLLDWFIVFSDVLASYLCKNNFFFVRLGSKSLIFFTKLGKIKSITTFASFPQKRQDTVKKKTESKEFNIIIKCNYKPELIKNNLLNFFLVYFICFFSSHIEIIESLNVWFYQNWKKKLSFYIIH